MSTLAIKAVVLNFTTGEHSQRTNVKKVFAETRPYILALHFSFSKDKKAMLSFTTGAMETMFRPDGINGDINVTLWPLQVSDKRSTDCMAQR